MDGIQVASRPLQDADQVWILEIRGFIDSTTAIALERELSSLRASGHHRLIVDLAAVDYISSAGWGVLISDIRDIRAAGGDLVLVGMRSDVHEIYELLEFQSLLPAFGTVEQAVQTLAHTTSTPSSG